MLNRIRNGTTTDKDAETVEKMMDSIASKSLRLLVVKWVLVLFLLGGLLLGIAVGGFLF